MTDDSYPDDVREIDGTEQLKKFVYQCRKEGFDPDEFSRMKANNFRQSGSIVTAVKMAQNENHLESIINWPDNMVPVVVLGYSKPESEYETLDPGNLKTIRTGNSVGKLYQIESIQHDEIVWIDATGEKYDVVNINDCDDIYCGYALAEQEAPSQNNYSAKIDLDLTESGDEIAIIWPNSQTTKGHLNKSCLFLREGDIYYQDDGVGEQLSPIVANGVDPDNMMYIQHGHQYSASDEIFDNVLSDPTFFATRFDNDHPIYLVEWNDRNKKVYMDKEDLGAIRSAKEFFDSEAEYGY